MRRFLVPVLFSVFCLVPAASWSSPPAPPFDLIRTVQELQAKVEVLQATVADLQSQLNSETTSRIVGDSNAIEFAVTEAKEYTDEKISEVNSLVAGLNEYVVVDTVSYGNPRIIFHDVNIQLVNGQGLTYTWNGLGNFLIGYDEGDIAQKIGSHNLVIGDEHTYTRSGGLVAGRGNTISEEGATVTGGRSNTASGIYSCVSGGESNNASGNLSSVSGGQENTASNSYSSISGGGGGTANGYLSSISGGSVNIASGQLSSVSGGQSNTASALVSTVSGGQNNTASGDASTVSGGQNLNAVNDWEHLPQ